MLVLTVLYSSISLAVGNAAATADSDNEADDNRPTVRITSPEKSPQKIVTITGPASGVTLNLDGTAFDGESSVDIVEVKVNDAATLQLLKGYETAIATGPAGVDDFSTWSKKVTFDEEGTYRVCARATDEAGNLNWWHVLVKVELEDKVVNGKIAFDRFGDDGVNVIFVMNADGSGLTKLNDDGTDPSWSPDGTKIVFERWTNGPAVHIMNADGSGHTNLTDNGQSPSWSPDGTKIAFMGGGDLAIINADGSGLNKLTNAAQVSYPSWSPDGTKIVFENADIESSKILVVNADGSGLTNLTDSSQGSGSPSWSPDGTKIAFISSRQNDEYSLSDVFVMNADGTGQTNLSDNVAVDYQFDWSPDGTKITFISDRDGLPEIYVMNADGSGLTRLTNNNADDTDPSWSPDGTKIVFRSQEINGEFNAEIHVVNADGSGLTNLTNTASYFEREPDWGQKTNSP